MAADADPRLRLGRAGEARHEAHEGRVLAPREGRRAVRDRADQRLHRVVRLARRPHRDEPPLRVRRGDRVEHARAQPPARRLRGEDARRGAACARHGRVRAEAHRGCHREGARSAEQGEDGPRAVDGDAADHAAPGRRRPEGGARRGVQRRELLGGQGVPPLLPHAAHRRPPRLRAAARDRRVWRRSRQLGVAAPHRRLHVLPRLRRQGRQPEALRRGQRAVPSAALAQDEQGRRARRRPRDRDGLPRQHAALPHEPRRRDARGLRLSEARSIADRGDQRARGAREDGRPGGTRLREPHQVARKRAEERARDGVRPVTQRRRGTQGPRGSGAEGLDRRIAGPFAALGHGARGPARDRRGRGKEHRP